MFSLPDSLNASSLWDRWRRGRATARADAPEEGAPPGEAVAAEGGGPANGERREGGKASWNLEPGAEIAPGRTVLRRLSGGSRYEVYLTRDARLFAITVTKILRPDQAADPHALGELRREAEILERLAHPCLVRAFGRVLEGPYPHVVLEHIDGTTLRRVIKQQRLLPPEQLLPLALNVAAVLQYMAAEGFVHLDVKPSNVVMGLPPRLIDLSIARGTESAARLRHAVGTDAYMAPEQCDPRSYAGEIGPAADVWGLGATLYHAAAGRRPFPGADRRSPDRERRFPQLVADPEPLPGHVPRPLNDLIMDMLAKEPARRPAAADVAVALDGR